MSKNKKKEYLSTEEVFKLLKFQKEKKQKTKKGKKKSLPPSKKWWKMSDEHYHMKHLLRERMDRDWVEKNRWFKR